MKRPFVLLLAVLLLLLGVQRTPEAQLGEIVVLELAAVGGCVHSRAAKPDAIMSPTETPATP